MFGTVVLVFMVCGTASGLSCGDGDSARGGHRGTGDSVLYSDISYLDGTEKDEYRIERCRLDVYSPNGAENAPVLVWFHGGGLEGGEKFIPEEFKGQGIVVVAVNYRLFPKCKCPQYIEDAAQALAWTFNNISGYGGSPEKIYVSGHSAGGYLTLMLVLAKKYTEACGADVDKVVKAYPISGQTATHYTIRKERGLDVDMPLIDEFAPSNNVRREGAPLVLITGDRNLEMLARYEENAHLHAILKHYGHPSELYELQGFNHGTVLRPACIMIREDIRRMERK